MVSFKILSFDQHFVTMRHHTEVNAGHCAFAHSLAGIVFAIAGAGDRLTISDDVYRFE